ncbi:TPA: hypothetical protein EYO57_18605 [Candidatus Poribacteria bacterium]|nr:hypothetical protein [Candidatus Poribacteria bacterium]
MEDSVVTLSGAGHDLAAFGDPSDTETTGFSFKLGDLLSNHALSDFLTVEWSDGDRMLSIQTAADGYGKPMWHLTGETAYEITFDTSTSNPRDKEGNPLDLSAAIDTGTGLTFEFTTAPRPRIDFHASKIGGVVINDLQGANAGLSPDDLPATAVTNVSTVIDLELVFTEPMEKASVEDSVVTLSGAGHDDLVVKLSDLSSDLAVRWSDEDRVLSIQPTWHLMEGTAYEITFDTSTSNPRDKAGNPLDLSTAIDSGTSLTFTFTTSYPPVLAIEHEDVDAIDQALPFDEGSSVKINIFALDQDHSIEEDGSFKSASYGILAFEVSGLPDGLRFIDNHDGTALIIGQLDYDLVDPGQVNDYNVDVTVRDEFNGTDTQGFRLTVNDTDPPKEHRKVTVSIGVPEPLPGVAVDIPIGTEITVPMDVKFGVNISIETSEGQTISSRDFRSEDGLIEFSMPVDLQPNMVYRVIESYMGKAVPDTPFSLPTFDFELEDQVWDFTSGNGTGAIPYQVEVQASIADLLTLVVGDFASSARIHGILTDMVDLELESTKDIPADTPIQFGSGFTLDFSRDVKLIRAEIPTLSIDLDASTDGIDSDISKQLNEEVHLAIVIGDVENLDSYSFNLTYDSNSLESIDVERGGILGDSSLFIYQITPDAISINSSLTDQSDHDPPPEGILAHIGFRILDGETINLGIEDAIVFNSSRDINFHRTAFIERKYLINDIRRGMFNR